MDSYICEIQKERELFSPLPVKKTSSQSLQNSQVSTQESKFYSPIRRNIIISHNKNNNNISLSSPVIQGAFNYSSPKKQMAKDLAYLNMSQSSIEENASLKSCITSHSEEMIEEVARLRTDSNNPLGKDRMFESSINKNQQNTLDLLDEDFDNEDLDDIMKSLQKELSFD